MFYKKKARKMPVTIKLNPDTRNASSAYASGALVQCRKVGAKNWGNSKKK